MRRKEGEDDRGDGESDSRRGGWGRLISVRNNKRRIIGPEWSMSEVGTPPPHNLEKTHGMVDSTNNNNNNTGSRLTTILIGMCCGSHNYINFEYLTNIKHSVTLLGLF